MALLTAQNIVRNNPVAVTYAAAAGGGDTFVPDRYTFLQVKNAGGGAVTLTIPVPGRLLLGDVAINSLNISVPATTGNKMIGPLPSDLFADSTTGLANVGYSGVTSVTVAVFRLTPS